MFNNLALVRLNIFDLLVLLIKFDRFFQLQNQDMPVLRKRCYSTSLSRIKCTETLTKYSKLLDLSPFLKEEKKSEGQTMDSTL